MNYTFSDLTPAEVELIGLAIDAMPYGKVAALAARLQKMINDQNAASTKSLDELLSPGSPT